MTTRFGGARSTLGAGSTGVVLWVREPVSIWEAQPSPHRPRHQSRLRAPESPKWLSAALQHSGAKDACAAPAATFFLGRLGPSARSLRSESDSWTPLSGRVTSHYLFAGRDAGRASLGDGTWRSRQSHLTTNTRWIPVGSISRAYRLWCALASCSGDATREQASTRPVSSRAIAARLWRDSIWRSGTRANSSIDITS